jgi:MOSC domain-containing protein YiiM
MTRAVHATTEELLAGLDHVRSSPADLGTVELLVRRPAEGLREVLDEAELDLEVGLVGDRWHLGSSPTNDSQLTLMNARLAQLVARSRERWPLAGDQLYVDLDLSVENLPAGTHLAVGETVVELAEVPHTGCAKFSARFGTEALKFVNKSPGRELRLRGANARVVTAGTVRVGDPVTKLI